MRIIDHRKQHKLRVLKDLNIYVKLFEDSLELLWKSIEALKYVDIQGWEAHQVFKLAFVSTLPKTLFSAFEQIMSGDYSEGMATCRIAYETLLRICFLEAYPDCHEATIAPIKGKTSFKATNFLRDDLNVIDEDPFYEFLSFPVHSHKFNVLRIIVESHQKDGASISQGFEYVEKDLHIAFNHLMGITYIAVRILSGLFNVHLVTIGYEIKEQKALRDLMLDMPGSFKALPELVDRILLQLEKMKSAHISAPSN